MVIQRASYFNRPALEDIQRRCLNIGAEKNHDYGRAGDGIAMGGVRGVVVRNLDKQLRCLSLTEPGHEAAVKDESLKDTLMDMINYCTYAVSLMEGTWGVRPEEIAAHDMGAMIREIGLQAGITPDTVTMDGVTIPVSVMRQFFRAMGEGMGQIESPITFVKKIPKDMELTQVKPRTRKRAKVPPQKKSRIR